MEPLSLDDSKDLFYNRVFGSKPDFSEQLKKYSEDIIRKCSGLPLATTIIASVFACQPDNPELWSHVTELGMATGTNPSGITNPNPHPPG